MPLYEYQCSKCGNIFEVIQKFSDEPLAVHEGCGGEVVRLISRSAFQLKGSGWYVTDYAKGSSSGTHTESSKSGDSSKSESKGDSAKGETKSEAKADTKSEAKSESKTESKSESRPAPASKSD